MSRSIIRFGIPLLGSAIVSIAFMACSSSKSNNSNTQDASTGGANTGGSNGTTGGSSGAAGKSTSAGGSTAAGEAGAGFPCLTKAKPDPGGTGKAGDPCCKLASAGNLSAGSCVKTSSIKDPTQAGAYGHDICAASSDPTADLKCQPTPAALADAGLLGTYDTCTATLGGGLSLEGRCLPKCFVLGQPASAQLKQDGCKTADMLCAPCYNPIDLSVTGACSQAPGDSPKQGIPEKFKACGALKAGDPDPGVCVPSALVTDPTQLASLQAAFQGDAGIADVCPANQVCAPTLKAQNINACFAQCTSIVNPAACVPIYLVPAADRTILANYNGVAPCKAGETCAPCLNPLTSMTTGACD